MGDGMPRSGDGDCLRGNWSLLGVVDRELWYDGEGLLTRYIAADGDGNRVRASGVCFLFFRADFGSVNLTVGFSLCMSSSEAVLDRRASDEQAADLTIVFSGAGGGL